MITPKEEREQEPAWYAATTPVETLLEKNLVELILREIQSENPVSLEEIGQSLALLPDWRLQSLLGRLDHLGISLSLVASIARLDSARYSQQHRTPNN